MEEENKTLKLLEYIKSITLVPNEDLENIDSSLRSIYTIYNMSSKYNLIEDYNTATPTNTTSSILNILNTTRVSEKESSLPPCLLLVPKQAGVGSENNQSQSEESLSSSSEAEADGGVATDSQASSEGSEEVSEGLKENLPKEEMKSQEDADVKEGKEEEEGGKEGNSSHSEKANIDFEEESIGEYVIQIHEMGLTEEQSENLPLSSLAPLMKKDINFGVLNSIKPASWISAVDKAKKGNSSELAKLVGGIDSSGLDVTQKKELAKVSPYSMHADIRLKPKGEELEGVTVFTGNQFTSSPLAKIDEGAIARCEFKDSGYPIKWMTYGDGKPTIFAPGEEGSLAKTWARIFMIDKGSFKCGKQDENYKEFLFNGKLLKGRYVFTGVPIANKRVWMLRRPKEQSMGGK